MWLRPRFVSVPEVYLLKLILASSALAFFAFSSFAQQPSPAKPANVAPTQTEPAAKAPQPPANPLTSEQAHELFELSGLKSSIEQSIHRGLMMQRSAAPPYIPETVWVDLHDSFQKVDFAQLLLPSYQKHLGKDEAEEILKFYRTPAGKHFLEVMPLVMSDISNVVRSEEQKIANAVLERHQPEIQAAQKKYDELQNQKEQTPPKTSPAEQKPAPAAPKKQ